MDSLSPSVLCLVTDLALEFLLDPKAIALESDLRSLSAKHSTSIESIQDATRAAILLFQTGLKENLSSDLLEETARAEGLNAASLKCIRDTWSSHSGDLTKSLLNKTISANDLVDME